MEMIFHLALETKFTHENFRPHFFVKFKKNIFRNFLILFNNLFNNNYNIFYNFFQIS